MTIHPSAIRSFPRPAIAAELTSVRGSSPREAGAAILIAAVATAGTIGGGALEYLVIQRARQALRDGVPAADVAVPLGPEIGQCCGGRVEVSMRALTDEVAAELVTRAERERAARPGVFVFGAGHVGQALVRALAPLPLKVHAVDTRSETLAGLPQEVEGIVTAMPEAVVRRAPAGSSFVILTHDHALDFLIAAEALARPDAPYIGMVGSKTKRARFASWYRGEGFEGANLERLVLPIGGAAFPRGIGDKRPEVIAALAAAEIMVHISNGAISAGAKPMRETDSVNGR